MENPRPLTLSQSEEGGELELKTPNTSAAASINQRNFDTRNK